MNPRIVTGLLLVLLASTPQIAQSQGLMRGLPPTPEQRVTKENWFVGPYNRWALQHVREITATTEISRGDVPVHQFEREYLPIADVHLKNIEGRTVTISDWLTDSFTDGYLVIHNGKIVTEIYMNNMTERSHHNMFSVSKSFAGNLAGILVGQGLLDPEAPITKYVPELANTAYGDARVRHLLDMTVGIRFTEEYEDPESDIFIHAQGTNATPNPDGLTLFSTLSKFPKEGEHGAKFHYVTADTDALGWVLQRASGRKLSDLLSDELWSKIGAERDAYVINDLNGTAWLGGGLNITLRDAGRFGLMMLQNGAIDGRQVVPAEWVWDIRNDKKNIAGPTEGYRSKWWILTELNGYTASGVSGQLITILPDQNLVVVKFSSWPTLSDYCEGADDYDYRALKAVVKYIDDLDD